MMTFGLIIIGVFLLIASIIDWKLKVLPSILLTSMLFFVAFLNPANLWFGAMAFIIGWLLMEADFFSGVADLKIMTMLGFMISSTNWFFAMILMVVCYGSLWKVMIKYRLNKEKDVAFVPVFMFIYLTLYILGAFA